MTICRSMHESYKSLLHELSNNFITETNARTNTKIKMLAGGWSFKLDLSHGRLPVPGNRKYWPHVAAAEVAWQFIGTTKPDFIMKHAPKIWSDFIEDGKLKTAYGYRWRSHFKRDQIKMAVDQLRDNPTNRQLYISAWDPSTDGLGAPDQPKNIPCPVGFSLTATDDELHMSLFIRSSDVFVGLPYDVMGYALTLDAIAASVDRKPGTLHVTLAHPHLYEPHFSMVRHCMSTPWTSDVQPSLPGWSVNDILQRSDEYVDHVKRMAARVNSSDYSPKPMVIV